MDNSNIDTVKTPTLPPEILYTIIALLFSEYLDDVIAGSHALPFVDMDTIMHHCARRGVVLPPGGFQANSPLTEGILADLASAIALRQAENDPAQDAPNSIPALLQASKQLRMQTLLVVSDALGIPVIYDEIPRLATAPWSRIHQTRQIHTNALLFHHLNADNSIAEIRMSSPVLSIYLFIGYDYLNLSVSEKLLETAQNTDQMDLFRQRNDSIRQFVRNMATRYCPNMSADIIPFEVLRHGVYRRVMTWIETASCYVLYKMALRGASLVFDNLKMAETLNTEDSFTVDDINVLMDDLSKMLSETYRCALGLNLPREYGGLMSGPNKQSMLALIDPILQHVGKDGTDYTKCRLVAQELRDWLEQQAAATTSIF